MVARDRIELSTQGFSILCSTPELPSHNLNNNGLKWIEL